MTTARISLEPLVLRIGNRPEDDVLLASLCTRCSRYFFPQRAYCGACAERTTETVELSGRGTLASFTRVHRKPEYSLIDPPYLLAEVTAQEGPRIYSVLVGDGDTEPAIGDEVRLRTVEVQKSEEGVAVVAYAFARVAD